MVESDTSLSIIHVYGDKSIFTNFDLWLSGWQDGGKIQAFQANIQKNIHSLYSDECSNLPFFHCDGTLTLTAV